ncbi:hypothetical protein ACFLXL_00235 [Chloroflexota bacterium]
MGSTELNPVMLSLGCNLEAKVLASIAVVFLLWALKKNRLLLPLNIGMGMVVLWNAAMIALALISN